MEFTKSTLPIVRVIFSAIVQR